VGIISTTTRQQPVDTSQLGRSATERDRPLEPTIPTKQPTTTTTTISTIKQQARVIEKIQNFRICKKFLRFKKKKFDFKILRFSKKCTFHPSDFK